MLKLAPGLGPPAACTDSEVRLQALPLSEAPHIRYRWGLSWLPPTRWDTRTIESTHQQTYRDPNPTVTPTPTLGPTDISSDKMPLPPLSQPRAARDRRKQAFWGSLQ
jgi:hypothetical protein